MYKFFPNFAVLIVTLLFSFAFVNISNENISGPGKIIFAKEANVLFGEISESVWISENELSTYIKKCNHYIMFQIKNNKLYILDDKRNVLFPGSITVKDDDVFHLFSKEKLSELIALSSVELIAVEKRGNVLTITKGDYTLEYSAPCPPYCY